MNDNDDDDATVDFNNNNNQNSNNNNSNNNNNQNNNNNDDDENLLNDESSVAPESPVQGSPVMHATSNNTSNDTTDNNDDDYQEQKETSESDHENDQVVQGTPQRPRQRTSESASPRTPTISRPASAVAAGTLLPPPPRDDDDSIGHDSIVPPTPVPPHRRRDVDASSPLSVPPTPLSLLPDHHHDQEQPPQQLQPPPQLVELDDDDDDQAMLFAGPLGGGETVIRGTDVHVPTAAAAFTHFLREFRSLEHSQRMNRRPERAQERRQNNHNDDSSLDDDDEDDDDSVDDTPIPAPFYLSRLEALVVQHSAILDSDGEMTTKSLDVDTMHLFYHNQACQRLYHQLVAYPMEIVPLFDLLVKREMERLAVIHQNQQHHAAIMAPPPAILLQVRPYHLRHISNLRCLDPVSMDSLLSIRGMVVRTSPIIPDLKVAHFSCTICGHEHQVTIDRGRIHEPHRCPSCSCRDSYQLVHNRSVFADKQLVRIQETPDEVPAGQTPASVLTFCFDDLVDAVQPGDRVEVTGVLRAQPRRVNPKITRLATVYKTYLDVIHFRRINGMESSNSNTTSSNNGSTTTVLNDRIISTPRAMGGGGPAAATTASGSRKVLFTPERIRQLQELAQQPTIFDQLVASLAPSIWGLDNVKKGVLCMLFGGNQVRVKKGTTKAAQQKKKRQRRASRKGDADEEEEEDKDNADSSREDDVDDEDDDDEDGTSKLNKRGDINILLCGDPGTSKSQLLTYVNKLSTRGVYTSGKGSSAVGLTASVVRDPETRDLVLESGALVLSDLGICCIDEFDKMSDTTRSVLHEAMEQQTVSIAKAGIIANLNARTSILASANPTESRYNPSLSVVENIKLPPTLLSRFDLIYLILDSPQVEQDRRLAQHMVGLYYETPNVVQPPLDQDLLRDYIEYARQYIHPELSEDASEQLIASYLEMRNPPGGNPYSNGMRTITATTRQLESLIRISEALAKMRFSPMVTRADVWEAVRLMKVATQAAATDPRTGRIDMDMINSGRSSADREMDQNLNLVLKELLAERRGNRMAVRDVTRQLSEIANLTFPHDHVMEALRRMEADGIIQLNERAQTIFVRAGIVN